MKPQGGATPSGEQITEKASNTGPLLIGGSILVACAFVLVAAWRDLSTLENIMFQAFTLGIGLAGSFIYGKDTARNAGRDLIRPVARSAFRRLVTICRGFAQLNADIAIAREQANGQLVSGAVLDRLEATVVAHTLSAADALADWEDVVPEEVNELRAALTSQSTRENRK